VRYSAQDVHQNRIALWLASDDADALAGRVVVVTGAGGGIGRAAVIRCVEQGASVLAADRNRDTVEETALIASRAGKPVASCEVDVADEDSVQSMIKLCVQHFGRIDCALNAAGIEGGRCELHKMRRGARCVSTFPTEPSGHVLCD
jgi:NAD(P)-dependent dehydrogenase (short-subunit alcohol dehydrogenase family)